MVFWYSAHEHGDLPSCCIRYPSNSNLPGNKAIQKSLIQYSIPKVNKINKQNDPGGTAKTTSSFPKLACLPTSPDVFGVSGVAGVTSVRNNPEVATSTYHVARGSIGGCTNILKGLLSHKIEWRGEEKEHSALVLDIYIYIGSFNFHLNSLLPNVLMFKNVCGCGRHSTVWNTKQQTGHLVSLRILL